eukprot:scaffold70082_cov50-Phaeocystis_antarctica.AAC.1
MAAADRARATAATTTRAAAASAKGRPRPGHNRIHSPWLPRSRPRARRRCRAWRRLHCRWLRPGQSSVCASRRSPRRNLPTPSSPFSSSSRHQKAGCRSSTAPGHG